MSGRDETDTKYRERKTKQKQDREIKKWRRDETTEKGRGVRYERE